MKFRIRFAEQIVGFFILFACGMLALVIILMGINQRWFAKDYVFYSRFSSGSGLKAGMPITLKGFQIGVVDAVELDDDNNVTIRFRIFDTYYEKIKKNSVLELLSNPLGLGGGLVLHPGKSNIGFFSNELIPENNYIPSLDFEEGLALKEGGLVEIPENQDPIGKIITGVNKAVADLNHAIDVVDNVFTEIKQGFAGEGDGPVAGTLTQIESFSRRLNGTMAKVSVQLDGILENFYATSMNLKTMSEEIEDPTGLVTRVLDPQGSIATFLNDENAIYGQINGALSALNAAMSEIKEFATFMSDATPRVNLLLEDGRKALEKGKDVLEGISNNPLIRGGIPEEKEQTTTYQGYRDEDF